MANLAATSMSLASPYTGPTNFPSAVASNDPAPTNGGGASASKKTKAVSVEPMDQDDEDNYESMKKWADAPSWAHLVDHIDTVERQQDGRLWVYFKLCALMVKLSRACTNL